MSSTVGYARVSTGEQNLETQVNALEKAGCTQIFQEKASGGTRSRVELDRMLENLQPGDVLVVWKLDRLTRSLKDLLSIMETVESAGAGFRSITEAIDTTTPAGRMMMHMVGVFSQFERDLIRERTRAALETARAKGRVGGRPRKLTGPARQEALRMVQSGEKSQSDVARIFGVNPATISRLVAQG